MKRNKISKSLIVFAFAFSLQSVTNITDTSILQAVESDQVLYVDFNNNVLDKSGKGNDGVVTGNPDYVSGVRGRALRLVNSTGSTGSQGEQFVNFGSKESMVFGSDNFSLSFWYKTNDGNSNGGALISNKNYHSASNVGFVVGNFEKDLRFNFTPADSSRTDLYGIAPVDDQWHHLVISVDRSDSYNVYLDGVKKDSKKIDTLQGKTISAGDFVVGADCLGNNSVNDTTIDELRVYKATIDADVAKEQYLSDYLGSAIELHDSQYTDVASIPSYDQDILKDYKDSIDAIKALTLSTTIENAKSIVASANAAYQTLIESNTSIISGNVLYVSFDDENANDLSGRDNHGEVIGSPEFVDGVSGKAIHIKNKDGSTSKPAIQYVNFKDASDLKFTTKDFSISFWYKSVDGGAPEASIVSNKDWDSGSNQGLTVASFKNGARVNYTAEGSGRKDIYGIAINDDTWHYVNINFDRDDKMIAYIDGNAAASADISQAQGTIDSLDFVLGADGMKQYGLDDAYIDEFRVYNRLATKEEMDTEYLSSKIQLLISEYEEIINVAKNDGVTPVEKITEFEGAIATIKAAIPNATLEGLQLNIKNLSNAYDRFLQVGTPLMSFQVISDPHIQNDDRKSTNSANLIDAFKDIRMLDPDSSALIIPGDFTDNGSEKEFKGFYDILNNFNPTPDSAVALGNHDVRWLGGWSVPEERYLRHNKDVMGDTKGKVYYDKWIDGYHFIVLNTELDLKDQAYLSQEQLDWLEEVIAIDADPNKPIFITIHQALKNTYEQTKEDLIGDQDEKLKAILAKYPQNVMFTGHLHTSVDEASVVNIGYGTQVDVPSFYYNGVGTDTRNCVGFQVNVYEDNIEVKTRDFKNDIWLPQYNKNIDIHAKGIEPTDDSCDLDPSGMSVVAGSQQNLSEAGSKVLDGDESTIWHSQYSNGLKEEQNLIFDLNGEELIDGLRILPRQTGSNGRIKAYEVYVSSDNQVTWEKVSEGKWSNNAVWKSISFNMKKVTHVKLQATANVSSSGSIYSSAAEVRITKAEVPVVNKDALLEKLNYAKTLVVKTDVYTLASCQLYQEEIDLAQQVYDDVYATQIEVDAALIKLENAKSLLVEIEEVVIDKDELNLAYQASLGKTEALYTKASWGEFKSARDNAKIVLDNTSATQLQVYDALLALTVGKDALIRSLSSDDGSIIVEANVPDEISLFSNPFAIDALTSSIKDKAFNGAYKIEQAYEIHLLQQGTPFTMSGEAIVKIRMNELLKNNKTLEVAYVDQNGNTSIMQSEIEGDYVVFKTTHFSVYSIVSKKDVAKDSILSKPSGVGTGDSTMVSLFVLMLGVSVLLLSKRRKD